MFSNFRAYDDEGYYLFTLHDYLAGHSLLSPYEQLYGPFFYEFFGGLFKVLGLAPDSDAGRFVTAAAWLAASLGAGLIAYRLSRSLWLAIGAQLLTFGLLSAMTNEPMNTYGISGGLLLALIGASIFRLRRPRLTAAAIGAVIGALVLVKVNVGGLAAIAVLFAWAAGLGASRRRLALPAVAGGMIVLPFVLMSALLTTEAWVLEFATVVALSIAAVGVATLFTGAAAVPTRTIAWFVLGGAGVAAGSIGIALAGGTTVADIWDGLVLAPLRIPRLLMLPLSVSPIHVGLAAVSLASAVAVSVWRRPMAGLVRVGAGFFILISLVWLPNAIVMAAVPLAWLAARGPEGAGDDPAGPFARALIPALAVLETVQAYPYAGTEASIAGLCLIPAGVLILGDGLRQMRAARIAPAYWVAPAVVVINVAVVLVLALTVGAAFRNGAPIDVPGAHQVRLPAQKADDIRQLVAAIDRDCSSFITYPGMNSLYVWTGQEPPTPVRVEPWWLTLDDTQQRSLVQQLSGKPRLCVVKNQAVIDMWTAGRQVQDTPLVDFIDRSFVRQGSYGDYELLVSSTS